MIIVWMKKAEMARLYPSPLKMQKLSCEIRSERPLEDGNSKP